MLILQASGGIQKQTSVTRDYLKYTAPSLKVETLPDFASNNLRLVRNQHAAQGDR